MEQKSKDNRNSIWTDPVKRAAFIAKRNASPGYMNRGPKIAAKAKERWADPEYNERMRASMKNARRNGDYSSRMRPITIDGVEYESKKAACLAYNTYDGNVQHYVKYGEWKKPRHMIPVKVGRKTYLSVADAERATGIERKILLAYAVGKIKKLPKVTK